MQTADVVRRVRYWRVKKGKTISELAAGIGVDSSSVYHWEADRTAPTHENVAKIARYLGLTLAEFYTEWADLAMGAECEEGH